MNKTILHIDFDSFFASCEQEFNPKFRNKPLGVTATNGRTCIIAASREAKRFGVKTGSRSFEAFKLCPNLLLTPANFIKYLEVSKKFLNICKDYTPFVELFSIDEVFMDITNSQHLFGGVYKISKIIKERIRKEIGKYITVSIGISHNKLLAKLASSINKPDGLFEITKENIAGVYKKSELTDICGIGERLKARLNKLGIYNLLELRNFPASLLINEFGKAEARFLKNVGFGMDESEVIPYYLAPEVKSIGRNYCLPGNEYNRRIVLQNFFELCEEISIKLRALNKKAKTIGFSLRGSIELRNRKTYSDYFDSGKEIYNRCLWFIKNDKFFSKSDAYIRQISVWVSNLEDKKNLPLSLFESFAKQNSLMSAVDAINRKFGDHTIRNGFLLYADKLTTMPNGYLGDKYERIKIAKTYDKDLDAFRNKS